MRHSRVASGIVRRKQLISVGPAGIVCNEVTGSGIGWSSTNWWIAASIGISRIAWMGVSIGRGDAAGKL